MANYKRILFKKVSLLSKHVIYFFKCAISDTRCIMKKKIFMKIDLIETFFFHLSSNVNFFLIKIIIFIFFYIHKKKCYNCEIFKLSVFNKFACFAVFSIRLDYFLKMFANVHSCVCVCVCFCVSCNTNFVVVSV